jgi:hypothetical protein
VQATPRREAQAQRGGVVRSLRPARCPAGWWLASDGKQLGYGCRAIVTHESRRPVRAPASEGSPLHFVRVELTSAKGLQRASSE